MLIGLVWLLAVALLAAVFVAAFRTRERGLSRSVLIAMSWAVVGVGGLWTLLSGACSVVLIGTWGLSGILLVLIVGGSSIGFGAVMILGGIALARLARGQKLSENMSPTLRGPMVVAAWTLTVLSGISSLLWGFALLSSGVALVEYNASIDGGLVVGSMIGLAISCAVVWLAGKWRRALGPGNWNGGD